MFNLLSKKQNVNMTEKKKLLKEIKMSKIKRNKSVPGSRNKSYVEVINETKLNIK